MKRHTFWDILPFPLPKTWLLFIEYPELYTWNQKGHSLSTVSFDLDLTALSF
jgi:hypothetical protein